MRDTKITFMLLILSWLLVLWWCWLKSMPNQEYTDDFSMDQQIPWKESNNWTINKTRPVWSWNSQLGSWNKSWSLKGSRMPMWNMTWDVKELVDKMIELRNAWDITWSDEIRKQLESKYPDLFSWAMRWPWPRDWQQRPWFQKQQNQQWNYDTTSSASKN